MFKYFKKYWVILVVFAICFWAVKPLFVSGFFPIHDDEQIARVFELDSALRDGQFPVRWVQHLGFGYGYPLFNFYPPLTYYVAEGFHLLGFTFINSTKLVFVLGYIVGAVFMYLWTKKYFGRLGAAFATLLYTYAPYHAVTIYVRGSLPDFFAYALLPAVFWAVDNLFKKQNVRNVLILGFLIALVPLTHILKVISIAPFLVIYFCFLLLLSKDRLKFSIFLSFTLLIALGLSAFFWLPATLEKNYTLVDKVNLGELYSYKLHFVYLRQFLNSPWGYGGSIFGLEDGLSFEIGKVHIFVSIVAFLFLIYSYVKKRISQFKITALIFGMFLVSVYLASFYSEWIWNRVGILSYLQFPWRFLTYSALFSSFLGGFLIFLIGKRFGKNLAISSFVILGSIAIILAISDFEPQKHLDVDDSYYTNLKDIQWRVSKASFEFVPKGVATKLSDIKTTQVDLDQNDIPKSPYKILNGKAEVQVVSNKSHSKIFRVKSSGKSTVQVNTFSFPGWKTEVDGKEVKYQDNNKLKLIVVDVPDGNHLLTANFGNTIPRAIGNAISLVTVFNLVGFGLFRLWKK